MIEEDDQLVVNHSRFEQDPGELYWKVYYSLYVANPDKDFAIQVFIAGVKNKSMKFALCSNDVIDMVGLIAKAHKLFDTQEMSRSWAPRPQQYE